MGLSGENADEVRKCQSTAAKSQMKQILWKAEQLEEQPAGRCRCGLLGLGEDPPREKPPNETSSNNRLQGYPPCPINF